MIVDAVVGISRLPLGLSGKTEFEYVKAKPLGNGFVGVPLRELRFELAKSLQDGRWTAFADGQYTTGFSGQTLETISLEQATQAFERPAGVPAVS